MERDGEREHSVEMMSCLPLPRCKSGLRSTAQPELN
jgi:hypothetical protein